MPPALMPPGSVLSGMYFVDAQTLRSRLDLPPESGPDYRPLRFEISSVTDRVRACALCFIPTISRSPSGLARKLSSSPP
jgi:hypothetical protein